MINSLIIIIIIMIIITAGIIVQANSRRDETRNTND